MSRQGPILIVADKTATGLVQALAGAGAFPVIETTWRDASAELAEIKPPPIAASEPTDVDAAAALTQKLAKAAPIIPMLMCLRDDKPSPLLDALTMSEAAPAEQLIARLGGLVRLRALHATVIARARTLKADRNIVSDM